MLIFISSLPLDVKEIARAVRGHWMVESYHWHLDETFREDKNHTLEKQAAFNQDILRKLALNTLKNWRPCACGGQEHSCVCRGGEEIGH